MRKLPLLLCFILVSGPGCLDTSSGSSGSSGSTGSHMSDITCDPSIVCPPTGDCCTVVAPPACVATTPPLSPTLIFRTFKPSFYETFNGVFNSVSNPLGTSYLGAQQASTQFTFGRFSIPTASGDQLVSVDFDIYGDNAADFTALVQYAESMGTLSPNFPAQIIVNNVPPGWNKCSLVVSPQMISATGFLTGIMVMSAVTPSSNGLWFGPWRVGFTHP